MRLNAKTISISSMANVSSTLLFLSLLNIVSTQLTSTINTIVKFYQNKLNSTKLINISDSTDRLF